MSQPLILKSTSVVFPDGIRPAALLLEGGLIAAVESHDFEQSGAETVDYGELAILPGLVDTHVHFNDPGRAHWEGWKTGTQAAVAGGVTAVVDMPLNCIPSTVDIGSLWGKRVSSMGQLSCDVGFWGGAVPGNAPAIYPLLSGGCLGLKCFLSDPGTEEFSHLDKAGLEAAMLECAKHDAVLLVHAEWPDELPEPNPDADPYLYQSWLDSRPVAAEREAIRAVVELSQKTGCRCHIVHVASHEVLDVLEGSGVSCETCAHYLVFAAEDIPEKATNFKCAPPIRAREHQEGLWKALGEGKISMITTDHSPCPPDLKSDNFLTSWGGIAGVQMLLPAVWTGATAHGFSLQDVAKWTSVEPAKLANLDQALGSIEVGKKAHLVVFDPNVEVVCESLLHRHPGSPYEGRAWKGQVKATYLRGERVYDGETVVPGRGELLLRP